MRSRSRLHDWAAALVVPALALGWLAAGPAAPTVAAPDATACVVEDASFSWGFKEAFRSYISGSIANGQWTVSDGAEYETPSFHFGGGSGLFDGQAGTGAVSFPGAITFTGHDGILNTTIANPVIEFRSDGVFLMADVSGTTQDGAEVDKRAVEFVSLEVAGAAGERRSADGLTLTAVPTTLTDAGSAAFGTYASGEGFDPITVSLDFEGECAVPADDADWIPWAAAGLALLVVLAIVLLRRGRLRRRYPSGA